MKIDLTDKSGKTKSVACEIVFSKRKTVSLQVVSSNQIKVRAPYRCPEKYIFDFVKSKSNWIFKHQHKIEQAPPPPPALTREEFEYANNETYRRIENFFETYDGIMPKKVTLRHQKTRWGSCSSNGNVSMNINCGLLPQELFEYVMIHELAHLYEMNHSPAFWSKVEERLPNYKELRKELKKYQLR